jgi:hypothetical protein
MNGSKGGPMAALSPLVTTWLPTTSAKISVQEDGDEVTVSVSDMGEYKSRLLRDTQGEGFKLTGGGFVSALGLGQVDLSPSSSRWHDPEMRAFETKSGARGNFNWSA